MERKRFSVLFFIKRRKLLKTGKCVRVTYDRLYVELQLKRSVKVPDLELEGKIISARAIVNRYQERTKLSRHYTMCSRSITTTDGS